MNAKGRIANGTNMSNQRRTIGRNMGHLLNFCTWLQPMGPVCPPASAKGPNFGFSLPVPVRESRQVTRRSTGVVTIGRCTPLDCCDTQLESEKWSRRGDTILTHNLNSDGASLHSLES